MKKPIILISGTAILSVAAPLILLTWLFSYSYNRAKTYAAELAHEIRAHEDTKKELLAEVNAGLLKDSILVGNKTELERLEASLALVQDSLQAQQQDNEVLGRQHQLDQSAIIDLQRWVERLKQQNEIAEAAAERQQESLTGLRDSLQREQCTALDLRTANVKLVNLWQSAMAGKPIQRHGIFWAEKNPPIMEPAAKINAVLADEPVASPAESWKRVLLGIGCIVILFFFVTPVVLHLDSIHKRRLRKKSRLAL